MAVADQTTINLRIIIEQPVIGVLHSLQAKDDLPLDAKLSGKGEPSYLICQSVSLLGRSCFGDQVRREGPVPRFVYIRVGQYAGDLSSPWSRGMKIDIHDIESDLLDRAISSRGVNELTVNGTGQDGTPSCATVRSIGKRVAER